MPLALPDSQRVGNCFLYPNLPKMCRSFAPNFLSRHQGKPTMNCSNFATTPGPLVVGSMMMNSLHLFPAYHPRCWVAITLPWKDLCKLKGRLKFLDFSLQFATWELGPEPTHLPGKSWHIRIAFLQRLHRKRLKFLCPEDLGGLKSSSFNPSSPMSYAALLYVCASQQSTTQR